tara:strand:+ start:968 stop:1198 length:231 start_codon:yes stop_codon:yes gene_type:complete
LTDYKKDLGLKESTSIVISRIIGCTSLFGLAWVLGGIITVFGTVIYAELTAFIPSMVGILLTVSGTFYYRYKVAKN